MSNFSKRNALLLCILGVSLGGRGEVHAQPADKAAIEDHVATTLHNRGLTLFELGDYANAKKMFSESLERSPQSRVASEALRLLRECNEKLGTAPPVEEPGDLVDPYGPGTSDPGEGPLDPYGTDPVDPVDTTPPPDVYVNPLDPYGNASQTDPATASADANTSPVVKSQLSDLAMPSMMAANGFALGMSVWGPAEDTNENGRADSLRGVSVVSGALVGAGSYYLASWLQDKWSFSSEQSATVASAQGWGLYLGSHLGNIFAGEDSDTNNIFWGMSLTGLAGAGAGYYYATQNTPKEGELSFINSFGMYGSAGGLLLGVALDPPRGDAYSLNAAIGTVAGLGLGMYWADGLAVSRERMFKVDLGAAAGAAIPWALVYPFTDSTQGSGFLSALGLAGGAYLAWRLTEDDGPDLDAEGRPLASSAPSPSLFRRDSQGHWYGAAPIVRPMDMPALVPTEGQSLGIDLASGRF